jgi:hypothetical protein
MQQNRLLIHFHALISASDVSTVRIGYNNNHNNPNQTQIANHSFTRPLQASSLSLSLTLTLTLSLSGRLLHKKRADARMNPRTAQAAEHKVLF